MRSSGRSSTPTGVSRLQSEPRDQGAESLVEEFEDDPDHQWHFRYNRRLSCFSHSISSLAFSIDGNYLVSGTGSGDVKVWDTGCWAEAGKIKGCKRQEPRALVISPAQRWLVAAYAKVLYIFNCHPPWKLEQSLPALVDPATKEVSEWACIAFSPMAEVDHPAGHAGQDNNLAAFSTDFLLVIDYSGGWGEDAPRRTRSLMQSGRPTALVYTSCGSWMICGFATGQLQIWNTASLTLLRTLSAHTDVVNCVDSSPGDAQYACRFVSCGVDQTLRVWHSQGWILEQHVHDTRCDRAGVRKCRFSHNGKWLLSVGNELCVWRINLSKNGRLALTLHQRLAAVCGAEGLRTAAFSNHDAIAVGSRDGVLGLWTKVPGAPRDPAEDSAPSSSPSNSAARRSEWVEHRPARPLQKVTMGGVMPLARPIARGEWLQQMHLRRTMGMGAPRSLAGVNTAAATTGRLVYSSPKNSTTTAAATVLSSACALQRTASVPELGRWRAQRHADPMQRAFKPETIEPSRPMSCGAVEFPPEIETAARKSIQHACRGLVTRIALDPKVITDHSQGTNR
mmetsp:Transcript_128070/g.370670  ORF Transcript_128070/g.370670 Transcript_128070/m.370670 type:complete len:564 (-) Transcript_128070:73-1764(-)